jgi:RNA polymerase sigma-70 factor (ECF subfamily)
LSDILSDADLLRGLRAGDRTAFDSLFAACSERVWRYVARVLGPHPEGVADVVQETFLSVVRSIDQFDPARGTLWAWIAGIAHNRSVAWWRARRRDDAGLSDERILAERNGRLARWFHGQSAPQDLLEAGETALLVREVLAELSSGYAECLIARYVDGQSAGEIAAEQGESLDAVRSRLSRARSEFRESFARKTREGSGSVI